MRLTLRTLLAYLDNTLDPQDAEALRAKIEGSGFATELVSRVNAAIESDRLSALPPDATGPLQDANTTSEYLDSTLTPEQVAEIERACLESDVSLAEVASCHQILTMALGQRADIPEGLRERIYGLPDQPQPGRQNRSFSDVSIPPGQPSASEAERASDSAAPAAAAAPAAIEPVGPEDSGVSDAPTRLREIDAQRSERAGAKVSIPALAGAKGRAAATDFYGRSIRPSRIAPWLVSLALVAGLLFALAQIFKPLYRTETAERVDDERRQQAVTDDIPGATGLPPIEPLDEDALIEDSGSDRDLADDERAAADDPAAANAGDSESEQPGAEDSVGETDDKASGESDEEQQAAADTVMETPADPAAVIQEAVNDRDGAGGDAAADDQAPPLPPDVDPSSQPDTVVEVSAGEPAADGTKDSDADPVDPDESPQPEVPPNAEVATVLSENTLLISHRDDDWQRRSKDQPIRNGATLVCPPFFRSRLSTQTGVELTLVGPARGRVEASGDGGVTLNLASGRVIVSAENADASIVFGFGDQQVRCKLAESDTVLGFQLEQIREPGNDPFVPDNRVHFASAWVSAGSATLTRMAGSASGNESSVSTGQGWSQLGNASPEISEVDSLPEWISDRDPEITSIDRAARDTLLQLVGNAQRIELALREAVRYRRAEVGALAARTLLLMRISDVYFGGDAVLNDADQKNYWAEHFDALTDAINRSVQSAEAVDAAIAEMDAAEHDALLRLLRGYSQNQLEQGADEELVNHLNSSSMAVRVLALENLRRITGETLYFQPWEKSVARRETYAKKWQVRLRRGDIRWPEESP